MEVEPIRLGAQAGATPSLGRAEFRGSSGSTPSIAGRDDCVVAAEQFLGGRTVLTVTSPGGDVLIEAASGGAPPTGSRGWIRLRNPALTVPAT